MLNKLQYILLVECTVHSIPHPQAKIKSTHQTSNDQHSHLWYCHISVKCQIQTVSPQGIFCFRKLVSSRSPVFDNSRSDDRSWPHTLHRAMLMSCQTRSFLMTDHLEDSLTRLMQQSPSICWKKVTVFCQRKHLECRVLTAWETSSMANNWPDFTPVT